MRSFIAFVLLAAAAASGLVGVGAHWVDAAARTPEPAREILAPVVQSPGVQDALADALTRELVTRLPEAADRFPRIKEQVERAIALSVDAALADPATAGAWHESIDLSRADAVAGLDAMRGGGDVPTIWFDATPFLTVGKDKLYARADPALRSMLDEIAWPEDLRLPLGRPDQRQADLATSALDMAGWWPWLYLGAAVAAAAGLLAGSRRGRWAAFLAAAVLATLGVLGLRFVLSGIDVTGGGSLASELQAAVVNGAARSLHDWYGPALWVCLGAVALGLLALIVSAFTPRGRAADVA